MGLVQLLPCTYHGVLPSLAGCDCYEVSVIPCVVVYSGYGMSPLMVPLGSQSLPGSCVQRAGVVWLGA